MIFILGNALFFKYFYPLHREGNFSSLMTEVIKREQEYRNTYSNRIRQFTCEIEKHSDYINPLIKTLVTRGGLGSVSIGALGFVYNLVQNRHQTPGITQEQPNSTIARNIAGNLMEGEGFNNPYINSLRNFVSKGAYEIGNSLGIVGQAFVAGFLRKNESLVDAVAESVDSKINEANKRIQDNQFKKDNNVR